MEFRLDDAQVELQQTVGRFCAARVPLDEIVAREGTPLDRVLWSELAGLGVFDVVGFGVLEAALVFEQLGSHLAPGPLLWTVLAAGLVDGAADGTVVVGGIEAGIDAGAEPLVEHAADLDILLVLGDDEVRAVPAAAAGPAAALDPLDPLTPVGRFPGLDRPGAAGEVVGGPAEAKRARLLGTVLSAAMLAGIAARALEVARAYALEREQFGAPIGSFQAVKHILADMYVRGSLAQSAAYAAAAVAQDPGDDDPMAAAAAAKLLAAEAAIADAGSAVQVLGGMGFTWDMLPNHLLKRAWVLESSFGVADEHALALGRRLVAGAAS